MAKAASQLRWNHAGKSIVGKCLKEKLKGELGGQQFKRLFENSICRNAMEPSIERILELQSENNSYSRV